MERLAVRPGECFVSGGLNCTERWTLETVAQDEATFDVRGKYYSCTDPFAWWFGIPSRTSHWTVRVCRPGASDAGEWREAGLVPKPGQEKAVGERRGKEDVEDKISRTVTDYECECRYIGTSIPGIRTPRGWLQPAFPCERNSKEAPEKPAEAGSRRRGRRRGVMKVLPTPI
jgi:hypothetical protein